MLRATVFCPIQQALLPNSQSVQRNSCWVLQHTDMWYLKISVCVLAFTNKSISYQHNISRQNCPFILTLSSPLFLRSRYKTHFFPLIKLHTSLSHTVISVLLISVRNHAVHFVGQFLLKARNWLTGSSSYEVGGRALHVVQTHVTGFGDLPLGKAHKLGVPGVDAETLRDQDLTLARKREKSRGTMM